MSRFRSIRSLLIGHSPGMLDKAIKRHGVYVRDRYGDIVKAEIENDGEGWVMCTDPVRGLEYICHSSDETKASKLTQSRVLALLADHHNTGGMEGPYQQSKTQEYRRELNNFGWDEDKLPGFEAIRQGVAPSTNETTEDAGQETASPETQLSKTGKAENPLSVFRVMSNLQAEDIRFVFLADRYIEVSANGTTRQVHLSAMRLINGNTKVLNKRGMLLWGMAQGRNVTKTEKNRKQISLIRTEIFREILGIERDPFHLTENSWEPRFIIDEEPNRADNRAKEKALRDNCKGGPIIDPGDPDRGKDDDTANWLKENSRKMK